MKTMDPRAQKGETNHGGIILNRDVILNPTDHPRVFTIEAGRMLSPKDLRSKVENLVVTKTPRQQFLLMEK